MIETTRCPDPMLLERLVRHGFANHELEGLEKHILGCSRCASLLDGMFAKDPLLAQLPGLRDPVSQSDPVADELVRRLLQIDIEAKPKSNASAETQDGRSRPAHPADATTLPSQSAAAPAFDVPEIPGYIIVEVLGRGGQSVVYKALQHKLDRFVALKVIVSAKDPQDRVRFLREAEAVAQLKHPHVVQIHDIGEHRGESYLSLEYVDGTTLARWIGSKPQPASASARMVETLARTMQVAHGHGIVHRDLKPSNILISADGTPKIADFGLVKRLQAESDLTHTGNILGTPSYMAPEQAQGKNRDVGPAADVYALGAILYEMLTGRPPFLGATSWETITQVLNVDPVSPRRMQPSVPRDLDTICLKCLAKDPAKRYPSAQDLAEDLERHVAGLPIRGRRTGALERALLWCRRRPALAGTIAAALVTIAVIGIVSLRQVLEERENFRKERDNAQAKLYRALVGESRLLMQGRDTGWHWQALDKLKEAASLDVADRDMPALRDLAIQSIGVDAPCFRVQTTIAGHQGPVASLAFDPDSRWLASAGRDAAIHVWSVPEGRPIANLVGNVKPVTSIAIRAGVERWLASASVDGSIRLWNLADLAASDAREAAVVMEPGAGSISGIRFTSDGASLLAACADGTLRMWDLRKLIADPKTTSRLLTGHKGPLTCLATQAGVAVTGSADRSVRVWDLESGESTDVWESGTAPNLVAIPDGASTEFLWGTIESFGITYVNLVAGTKEPAGNLHVTPVRDGCFDRRGRFLTGSSDGTMKLWARSRFGLRSDREIAVAAELNGPGGPVRAVAIDDANRWAAAGHDDGRVVLWEFSEPAARKFVTTLSMQRAVFVGDERTLALDRTLVDFGSERDPVVRPYVKGWIKMLAVQPGGDRFVYGEPTGPLTIANRLRPADAPVRCEPGATLRDIASAPDGRFFATAATDGIVKLWNWSTGACERTVNPELGPLHGLAWSPDGRTLGITGRKGVALCEPEAQGACRMLRRQTLRTSSIAISDNRLACTNADGTIEICDLATGRNLQRLKGHTQPATALRFSPDGTLLASVATNDAVRLWNLKTGEERSVFRIAGNRTLAGDYLAFDPTGHYLVSDSIHDLWIWDLRSETPVGFTPAASFAFEGKGDAFLFGEHLGGVLRSSIAEFDAARAAGSQTTRTSAKLVEVFPKEQVVEGGHTASVWGLAASPDGRFLVTGGHDTTVRLWDIAERKLLRTLYGRADLVWCVAVSPDSKYVAAGSGEDKNGTVEIWEADTGRPVAYLRGHKGLVRGVAFHPGGRWLVSCNTDGTVLLWNWAKETQVGLLHAFEKPVYDVAFSPDGRRLAAACHDRYVALWEFPEDPGTPPKVPQAPTLSSDRHPSECWAVGFSPDGRILASGSAPGVIVLRDAHSLQRLATLRGGPGETRCIASSRDGELLAGAQYGGPTTVWDLPKLRRTLAELKLDW